MSDEYLSELAVSTAEEIEELDSFYDYEWMDCQVRANINGQLNSIRMLTQFGGPNVWIKTNGRSLSVLVAQGSDHHEVHANNEQFMNEMWDYFAEQWEMAETKA